MSSKRVILVLYKSFLRVGNKLAKEISRHKTTDVFTQTEVEWFQKNYASFLPSLLGGAPAITRVIKDNFRNLGEEELDSSIDLGFSALRLLNLRLEILRRQAVDPSSIKVTNGIRVVIHSQAVPYSLNSPGYWFTYKVSIKNESCPEPVQLLSREWEIMDHEGSIEKVTGPGVVGKQPIMETGTEFGYTSFASLKSRKGTMEGKYHMIGVKSGAMFDVDVGPLALQQ